MGNSMTKTCYMFQPQKRLPNNGFINGISFIFFLGGEVKYNKDWLQQCWR